MKIIFTGLNGRRQVRRFNTWPEVCHWLKKNFLAVDILNNFRSISTEADNWHDEVTRRINKAL